MRNKTDLCFWCENKTHNHQTNPILSCFRFCTDLCILFFLPLSSQTGGICLRTKTKICSWFCSLFGWKKCHFWSDCFSLLVIHKYLPSHNNIELFTISPLNWLFLSPSYTIRHVLSSTTSESRTYKLHTLLLKSIRCIVTTQKMWLPFSQALIAFKFGFYMPFFLPNSMHHPRLCIWHRLKI